jgi:hypothetical protein
VLGPGEIGYQLSGSFYSIPTMQMGNVARVDAVYGNDSTAYIGGLPFATVNAAITAIVGTGSLATPQFPNTAIWVLPGTYTMSPTGTNATVTTVGPTGATGTYYPIISLPARTALRGISLQTCTLQCTSPTQNTILLQMGDNCRVEDLNMVIGGSSYAGSNNLIGIYYGSTTTVTSKLRTSVLSLSNATMPYTASNNLYGVMFDGSGSLGVNTFSFNAVKGSTINVYGNGSGNKRGLIVTNTNIATLRDTNVYVAQPPSANAFAGSYVGIETLDGNNTGSIQLRSTTVGTVQPVAPQTYTASDILQTTPATIANPTYLASPGIQIGPGVDLVTKTAGSKGFSAYNYPTSLFYGAFGTITNGQLFGWLWPGTMLFGANYPDTSVNVSSNPASYRAQQSIIVAGINVTASVTGTADLNVTIYKNPTATIGGGNAGKPASWTASHTVTVSAGTLNKSFYDQSINFAAGDRLGVYIVATDNHWQDIGVQVDCF